ncbi:TIGR04282 family arsenosugar biosynthesis glycosyltransferase [Rhodocyclaceae bacterium SMB388]
MTKAVRIIVFAKAPWPGHAKTRLIPALGAEGAASLAALMLRRTMTAVVTAGVGPVELCVTPDAGDPAWRGLIPDDVLCSDQGPGDLGERMARASRRAIEAGEKVILIGTDCVELSPGLLIAARDALTAHDALIHPTVDGGYALLGLSRFDDSVFDAIAWSTDTVAETTIGRTRDLGWSLMIGERLHDIDTPADLCWISSMDRDLDRSLQDFAPAGTQRRARSIG